MSELNLLLPEEEDKAAQKMTDKMKKHGVSSETIDKVQNERRTFVEQMEALSPDELRQVDELAGTINIHSSKVAAEYALSIQRKLNDLTDSQLEGVADREVSDVGELIARMTIAMKTFNGDFNRALGRKPGIRLFRKEKQDFGKARQHAIVMYGDVLKTLNDTAEELTCRYEVLSKNQAAQEQLYDRILDYLKELTVHILAAKKALDNTVRGELVDLQRIADKTGSLEDAQAFQDCQTDCSRFEKRIYDLELTRQACPQFLSQIRTVQGMNCHLMQQIVSVMNNSIPIWKQGVAVGLSPQNNQSTSVAINAMGALTGAMIETNAKTLSAIDTEAVRQTEMSYISSGNILERNEAMIKAINDITEMHRKGLAERNAVRKCMADGEAELAMTMRQACAKAVEEWSVI